MPTIGNNNILVDRSIKLVVKEDFEQEACLNVFEVVKKVKIFGKYYLRAKNKAKHTQHLSLIHI